jgi:uncharacterized protein (TIGR00730 family)
MRVCVLCASSNEISDIYFDATEIIARELVTNNIEVVYGGGASGLMGKLANTIIDNKGKIVGIIPLFMYEKGWAHNEVSELIITNSLPERKAKYLDNIDGVIALPGGTGTLEELLEIITLKRLGQFSKPIVILNTNGYYAPLKIMLDKSVNENFMNKSDLNMWTIINNPADIMKYL